MSNEKKAANDDIEVWTDGGVSLKKAAEWTGLSRTSLYTAMSSGELVFTKCGSRRVIAKRSLQRLLANGASLTLKAA